jgi:hypothetical protein
MTFVFKQCTWHRCSNNISRLMTFVFIPYGPMIFFFCMIIIAKLWPMKFVMQGCQYHFHTSKTYLHLWTIGSWINYQHYHGPTLSKLVSTQVVLKICDSLKNKICVLESRWNVFTSISSFFMHFNIDVVNIPI